MLVPAKKYEIISAAEAEVKDRNPIYQWFGYPR